MKAKGLKICVWINPYIAQESVMFDEGMEGGYFLKRPDGSVWQWDMWQPGMAIVDFTNPEAKKWYLKKLEALVDMGVDCFKTDFGERIPTDCVYYDKKNPEKMHNYYTYLYNEAVFEVLEKKKGKDEAVLFARSATAGGQKFRYTGAETAGLIMNPWKKVCVADYPYSFPDLGSGAMISADLKTLLPRMSIRDGVRLVCFLLTAVCMEVHHTVCRGLMTMRPWMCCAALYA